MQYSFMIKSLSNLDTKGITKTIYDKLTASIILNSGRLKSVPLRSGMRHHSDRENWPLSPLYLTWY